MTPLLKNITYKITNDVFVTKNQYNIPLAESIYEAITHNILDIKNEALRAINAEDNAEISSFITSYIDNKALLMKQFVNYTDIEQIKRCIIHESQYIYKNCQILSNIEEFELITTDSCCPMCRLLADNPNKEALSKMFKNDFCDSYLVLPNPMITTDNIINANLRVNNVPNICKRSLLSLYQILTLKFYQYLKPIAKIKYVYEFEEDKDMIYKQEEDYTVIKFSISNYKRYFVKSLLQIKDIAELKELYYTKISKDTIYLKNKFINYLASQSYETFYIESLTEYILNPKNLQYNDNDTFICLDRLIYGNLTHKMSLSPNIKVKGK